MSSSMLAGITQEATCHVRTLADEKHWIFALTSTSVDKLAASASAVAILYDRSSQDTMQRELTIWTLRGKIPIQCHTRPKHLTGDKTFQRETKIMIGTKIDYVAVIEECFNEGWCMYLARFGFDGRLQSQVFLPVPATAGLTGPLHSSLCSAPDDGTTIWSYCHAAEASHYIELTHVQYDPQRGKLQLKTNRIMQKSGPKSPKSMFIWKDIAYYVECGLFPQLKMIDLSENKIKCTASMGAYHQPTFRSDANFSFFGDENFLVCVCDGTFQAWSFNKYTRMTHKIGGYARYRQMRMDRRLERKRARDAEAMARILRQEEINLEVTGSVGNYHAFRRTES